MYNQITLKCLHDLYSDLVTKSQAAIDRWDVDSRVFVCLQTSRDDSCELCSTVVCFLTTDICSDILFCSCRLFVLQTRYSH